MSREPIATEDPVSLEAFGMAVVLAGRGQTDEAVRLYERALRHDPGFVEARYNLANVRLSSGCWREAESHYRQIPAGHPLAPSAWANLGILLARTGRTEDAVAAFAEALAADPGLAQARYGIARTLLRLGRPAEAVGHLQILAAAEPNNLAVLEGLAQALTEGGRTGDALPVLRRLAERRAEDGHVHSTLGRVLALVGYFDEAEHHLRRALDLDPERPRRHAELGAMLQAAGRLGEAVAAWRGALALRPEDPDTQVGLAAALLARGDLREGFAAWEARLLRADSVVRRRNPPGPLWDGSPPQGRPILVYEDGDLGTILQFIRYVPLLVDLGAQVVLACEPRLLPLLSTVEGLSDVVSIDGPLPACAAHVPLTSLPHRVQTTLETIPAMVPYLTVAPGLVASWGRRLAALQQRPGLRVGLSAHADAVSVSSPSPSVLGSGAGDYSIPFAELARLSRVADVTLYNLQRGVDAGGQFARLPPELPIVDLGLLLEDGGDSLVDTAAILHGLDLVVAVDAPVAHLAGALGRPLWVPLTCACDWRWLTRRVDSPWYPTARLFRQPSPGDWSSVMAAMTRALADVASGVGMP